MEICSISTLQGDNFIGNALDQRQNLPPLRHEPVPTPVPVPLEFPASSTSSAMEHNKSSFRVTLTTQGSRGSNPASVGDNVNLTNASLTAENLSPSGTHSPQTDNSPFSSPPDSGVPPHSGSSSPPPNWRLSQPTACILKCKASPPPSYQDVMNTEK